MSVSGGLIGTVVRRRSRFRSSSSVGSINVAQAWLSRTRLMAAASDPQLRRSPSRRFFQPASYESRPLYEELSCACSPS